jgi:RNA polymerase sigma-70 factor (ECF subfamily)
MPGRDLGALTDEELLLECRGASDPDVIRRCIGIVAARHHAGVIRFLVGYVGSAQTAEDLAQEAFIRLYRHAREYREVAKASTWLYKIATNLALNEIRDRKRRPKLSLDAPVAFDESGGRELGAEVADVRVETPAALAEARDLRERVRRAVDELPELFRSVILLCDLEGLSYQEAAEVLDVPIGTVRSRLFRARERVQERLGPTFV